MKPKDVRVPPISTHKRTGRRFVQVRLPDGSRKQVYLRGECGSSAEQAHYRELLANLLAGKPVTAPKHPTPSEWPTAGQLCAAFLLFADRYYRNQDGVVSGTVANFDVAIHHLLDQHRDTPTDRFSIVDLTAVRQGLVDSCKFCRTTINSRMALLKQVFKWGVSQRLVPGSTWAELSAFRALPPGRGGVRDNPPVTAVPWKLVEEVLPHLTPTIRAAVLCQWFTGCRPAELLSMTRRQLDMTASPWLFTVTRHKARWRGVDRVVPIGPRAQEQLLPYVTLDLDRPVFSPRTSWAEYRDHLRAQRRSPATKQTRDRDTLAAAAEPKAEFFDVPAYRRAIHRACDKAGVPRWSPHRLRHACGTRLAVEEGIEVARATLGHADARMTRHYAKAADVALAAAAAARHG